MGQRLALVAVEENDVAGFGLLFAQAQATRSPLRFSSDGPSAWAADAASFFRKALDSCERLMRFR